MINLATTKYIPINGTSEVQTVTLGGTITGGTFYLAYNGLASSQIAWSATTATLLANVQAALDELFGANNSVAADSTLSSGVGDFTVTFQNGRGALNMTNAMTAGNSLTGTAPTVSVARTTKGVTATARGAALGTVISYVGQNGKDEIQTLTFGGTPSTGNYTVTLYTAQGAQITTAAISWSATNATLLSNLQNALDTAFGSGQMLAALGTITSGVGTVTIQFIGNNTGAKCALGSVTIGTYDGTLTIAETVVGGTDSGRNAPPYHYVNNSGTLFNPNWQPSGETLLLDLGSPAVGAATAVHAAVSDTGSTQTITTGITNPDIPRTIVLTPGGTTGNVTAVSCTITGTDANGNPLVEVAPAFSAGAGTAKTTVNAFKTVTKISQPAIGTSVTVSYGTGPAIGLGLRLTDDTLRDTYLNGVRESTRSTVTPSTVLSKSLISLNSTLNGDDVKALVTPS